MFMFKDHFAKPVQPVSGTILVTMSVVVVATSLLGVGCLLSSFWQDAGQWPVSPPTVGTSGELLGAAFASLVGLLTPLALGCVVLLQNQQLRFERQQLAHARYEFAIETALHQCSRPARRPPPLPSTTSHSPATESAKLKAAPPTDACTLADGVEMTLQQTHFTTLATIRAVDTAIKVCELRLTHGAGETEALELQQLISRLHRRLQRLEHDAATDLEKPDHE